MQYMLLIHHDERAWDALGQTRQTEIYGEYRRMIEQLQSGGQYLSGSQLQSSSTATSVRIRDGKRLVTDGPFAETHEQLGGYFVLDVKDLDEAIAVAARIPSARMGTIEVRPLSA